jgi:Zn finger protein HypA/HybF involved in hydrogenase expression
MKLAARIVKCLRCAHEWIPRKLPVLQCPRCKSVHWNVPKGKKRK